MEQYPFIWGITLNSTRAEIATKRYVVPEKWNHSTQKVIGNSKEARSLNAYLKTLEQQVYHAHRELMIEKLPLTAQSLKKVLFGEVKENISLIEVFNQHNRAIERIIG